MWPGCYIDYVKQVLDFYVTTQQQDKSHRSHSRRPPKAINTIWPMLIPPHDENCCGARHWNAWLVKRRLGETETLLRLFAWLVQQRLGEAETQRRLGEVETLLPWLGEVKTLLPQTLLPLYQ